MLFSDAREIFLEGDVEDTVEGVFDLPMGAHGPGGLFGGQCPGGDVVARGPGAVSLVRDAGLGPDDGDDFGKAVFAAPAPGHPVDGVGDLAAAVFDAPMTRVVLDMAVDRAADRRRRP